MEIGEIISDAIMYPINNIKALAIYLALGIIAGIVLVLTGVGPFVIGATSFDSFGTVGLSGILGGIIVFVIFLLISGYELDIIKIGILRGEEAPSIDFTRQVINGLKLIIVGIIYMIIPIIVLVLLAQVNKTLGIIVGIILLIVFGLALIMAQCRFADSESLGDALNVPEAINDLRDVGIIKVLAILIIIAILSCVLNFIAGLFTGLGDVGSFIGSLLSAIFGVYMGFVQYRSYGLLYSDA
ncbi:DUF4013 domain-containing protein [uncultured Methanobrevibacter sp.]|uniref:DUF4013 domain-containing protein n=1 Tax=uncultured Methanobrevibacter sp. TaxID=253161 RepID=UPI00260FFF24